VDSTATERLSGVLSGLQHLATRMGSKCIRTTDNVRHTKQKSWIPIKTDYFVAHGTLLCYDDLGSS
jgi:hypothetical protein